MVIQKNPEIIRQNFGVQLVHVMKFLSCCKLFFPRNGKIILLTQSNNNEQIVIGLTNQKSYPERTKIIPENTFSLMH